MKLGVVGELALSAGAQHFQFFLLRSKVTDRQAFFNGLS